MGKVARARVVGVEAVLALTISDPPKSRSLFLHRCSERSQLSSLHRSNSSDSTYTSWPPHHTARGHLNRIRASLKYRCPAEHIPPKIEVDVSNRDIGDRVLMRDVELHPSLKLLSKNENMAICKIDPTTLEFQEPASL